MFVDFNEVTGRYHIYTEHGSDTGRSYGRRADAQRGLNRLINAA